MKSEDLPDIPYNETPAYLRGLETRLAVLGDAYAGTATETGRTDPFTHDLQQIVNEHVWGSVWSRPGLSLRDRSIVVISVLATMGQEDELKLHVRGALRNGVSKEELSEIFHQIGAYAGMPRCLAAFRAARAVLSDVDVPTQ